MIELLVVLGITGMWSSAFIVFWAFLEYRIWKEKDFKMIKDTNLIGNGAVSYILCDSCYVKIAECEEFQFEEGQELIILVGCVSRAGGIHNKDCGEKVAKIEAL